MSRTDLGLWVKEARNKLGVSQGGLAKLISTPQSTVAAWETGRGRPSFDDVVNIVKATGHPPPADLTPADDDDGSLVTIHSAAEQMLGSEFDRETIHSARVPADWLKATYPNLRSVKSLGLLTNKGDSMADTFNSGDVLLVDMAVNEFTADAVYAFSYRGNFFVKRLMRRLDGGLMVISDNKQDYPTQELPPSELEHLKVQARVVGTWKWKQL